MNFKKLFVIVLLFIFSSFLISTRVEAAAVTGWAWSSNVGWVQFDTGSASPVTIATTSGVGTFSGYAWSSNIGWISFNATAGCPIMPANGTCQGKINMTTGAVTGWARACTGTINKDCASADRTDGWDGWIELSGVNHTSPDQSANGGITFDPATGDLKGYAFSQVIGWLQFNAKCPGCVGGVTPPSGPTVTCSPSATTIAKGNDITWTAIPSGGTSVYTNYDWKNEQGNIDPTNHGISFRVTYPTPGTKSMSSRVTDSSGSVSLWNQCSSSVTVTDSVAMCPDGVTPVNPGPCPSTPVSDNGALWITRPTPISTTKQIRVNQSVDLKWILPGSWLGCAVSSTITPANPPTVSGWTGLNVYSTTTTTLPRMRIGDYSLTINCNNGSSTNAVLIKVIDPNTGEI